VKSGAITGKCSAKQLTKLLEYSKIVFEVFIMNFSNEEQAYINFLDNRKSVNINDFLLFKYNHILKKNSLSSYHIITINKVSYYINTNDDMYPINYHEEDEVLSEVAHFYSICEYLNVNKYINIINIPSRKRKIYFLAFIGNSKNDDEFTEHYTADLNINKLIIEYSSKRIFSTPELTEYIKNGYKTRDDIELKSEKDQRKKAEKWTRILAIASIIVSILITLFNFSTYKNSREVTLTNDSIFKDPITVKIKNINEIINRIENYQKNISNDKRE
jgi:hypothetical protein